MPDRAGSQCRTLRRLLAALRTHLRRDAALPLRIERLLKGDRRLGSRDRRLYRELIYTTLRYLPWIEPLLEGEAGPAERVAAWLSADIPATRSFREALVGGWPRCPGSVSDKSDVLGRLEPRFSSRSLLPAWFAEECPEGCRPPDSDLLTLRAPLWLRVAPRGAAQTAAELASRGWKPRPSELLPTAVEVEPGADVTATEAYLGGLFEIQDLGSQMILESAEIEPGGRWLDACAGAGGKTLQLALLLGPGSHVDACDPRKEALVELGLRAARAGLSERIGRPSEPAGPYDGVLVDAPCSGSGTWRRSPHLKWVTTPARIGAFARDQLRLLEHYAPFVARGGRLIYATCSLCRTENDELVAAFLARNPAFSPMPAKRAFRGHARGAGLLFFPSGHNGDGFFTASLRREA